MRSAIGSYRWWSLCHVEADLARFDASSARTSTRSECERVTTMLAMTIAESIANPFAIDAEVEVPDLDPDPRIPPPRVARSGTGSEPEPTPKKK